ncbi:MAG: hypothetical protein K0M78_08375 [Brevundimonas sp.]|nr:hypothetical protein [Brevundimonas sp.]
MTHNPSRAIQAVSLMILGGALLFDLPVWFGLIGLALGVGALFLTERPAR